jgi:hypothetical protein
VNPRKTVLAAIMLGAVAGLLVGDEKPTEPSEPPVRLKKKGRPEGEAPPKQPMPDGKKPERLRDPDAQKDAEPEVTEEIDEQETLARVARNMRSSEERLANQELGESTRQVQRDILKDLDLLIELSKNPPQNQSQDQDSQSDPSSSPRQGQQKGMQKQSQRQQQAGRQQRRMQRQQARNRGRGQPQRGQEGQSEQPMDIADGNQPGGGGKGGKEDANKIADIYKEVWGHLPESMRAEMNAYSREQFMAKYEDVIKKYYSAISEKSRRKGD